MKYIYPAIFEQDNNKIYLVSFPDLDGCYTDGKTLEEALENAGENVYKAAFRLARSIQLGQKMRH